jgi:pimeloyl-ACP methyl ester carboxylesterase
MIEVQGRSVDCVESGEGPPLLFLPGSYSTPAAWRPVQRLLAPGWRMVATSLAGYGASAETRSRQDFGIQHEVELVRGLLRHAGTPVHLVGHSFGGTVALATALAARAEVASLTLFEANPLPILRHGHERLYSETLRMSLDFEAAVDAGEIDAPRRIIDFWGGAGVFAAMPEAVKAYCRQTAATNVIDWRTAFAFTATAADYAQLNLPVLLVRGALANPAMVAITDELAACLPQVRTAVVDGAGHFLITSHAVDCARLLSSFLAEVA